MTNPTQEKWDARYREMGGVELSAAAVLLESQPLIPASGRALDLACGLGANALYLAQRGLEVAAWDISVEAIARLKQTADNRGLLIHTEARDIIAHPPAPESFDLIVVSRFLERALCPAISAALKPNGLLFYQTFTCEHRGPYGPRNPAFLLQRGELRGLFAELRIEAYREAGEAWLVARKG